MIAVVAIASVAMATNFSDVQTTIADEGEEPLYKMADGTQVIVTFEFREGTEQYVVPVFSQQGNFDAKINPTFTMQKTVGNTPYLHEAADVFRYWNMAGDASYQHMYKEFTANIDFFQEGKHIRNLNYDGCSIIAFETSTLFDKEEGYMGKGFAVVEDITVECQGYDPNAIDYDDMVAAQSGPKSKTISSLDLKEDTELWKKYIEGQ
jgi:hypothetical protein